ncbi:MAG TPA: pyridoxamine 5'-phosphate oxidase family protein [Gammaproteobacteria bacterium]|nr:pyridoxamine 5'-phosphate oxidase family protein [Gammaproteobacteria bacterium]
MEESEHLCDLLKGFDTAMLVTRARDGYLHARPMAVAELRADADAYFVTSIDSPKIAEIDADADVLLTFQSERQYAAVYGRVNVVQDRQLIERLWKEEWKVWFPQGKSDPSIALLRFDAERGEFWDNAGTRGVEYAFEAAKAYVRGEKPHVDSDQHGRVRLS